VTRRERWTGFLLGKTPPNSQLCHARTAALVSLRKWIYGKPVMVSTGHLLEVSQDIHAKSVDIPRCQPYQPRLHGRSLSNWRERQRNPGDLDIVRTNMATASHIVVRYLVPSWISWRRQDLSYPVQWRSGRRCPLVVRTRAHNKSTRLLLLSIVRQSVRDG